VDADLCAAGGVCADDCQFEAISLHEDHAVVDEAACVGCGVRVQVRPGSHLLAAGPGQQGAAGNPRAHFQLTDIEKRAAIQNGDFVFFRTDWSKYSGTDRYYKHPELSFEVVQWLASMGVNAVGIDALGLGQDRRHGELIGFWLGLTSL
jgi:ferredoxin